MFQSYDCVLQEAFGFIERGDVVKEIFFHYSEFKGDLEALQAGDDVEFTIKERNVSLSGNKGLLKAKLYYCSIGLLFVTGGIIIFEKLQKVLLSYILSEMHEMHCCFKQRYRCFSLPHRARKWPQM